jgi:hypothetical protein
LRLVAVLQQGANAGLPVHEGQHEAAEQREVPLELPRTTDTGANGVGPSVPVAACVVGEQGATARVQRLAPSTWTRADELEELAMA